MRMTLLIAALLIITTKLSAQTTEEEYNYITKGYAIQISSGLDMKKGYKFTDLTSEELTFPDLHRIVKFKALTRTANNSLAAIMIIYSKSNNEPATYLCIPHYLSDKEMWDRCLNELTKTYKPSREMLLSLTYSLMKLSAQFASKTK